LSGSSLALRLSFKFEPFDSELFKSEASFSRGCLISFVFSVTLLLAELMPLTNDLWRLDSVCRLIATGRGLARRLTAALREYRMSETEFRLLWLLRSKLADSDRASVEQSALATQLGSSPAQISAIVERLRSQKIIASDTDANDRRRRLWQLTPSGREQFEEIIAAVGLLSRGWTFPESIDDDPRSLQEDAA